MKYFIDNDNRKVGICWCVPSALGEVAHCWDANGKEYDIPLNEILEDDEPDFVEVSLPIEFPKEFVPGVKFDDDRCMWCPFFCVEENVGCYCDHKHYDEESGCPIRKHFEK